jgi:hypothetical protein
MTTNAERQRRYRDTGTNTSCATCRHSQPTITDDDDQPILKCHRYPPTLFVLDGELTQAWPDANHVCGEWQQ